MSNASAIAQVSEVTPEKYQGVFHAAFIDCVGTYHGAGKIPLKDLSAQTGILLRTLQSYRDNESCPSGHKLMLLMGALPPRFTNRMLSVIGMGGAKAMTPEEIGFHDVAEGAANYTKMFITAMADGRIDHVERPQLIRMARQISDNLTGFLHRVDNGAIRPDACTDTGPGKVASLNAKRAGAK